MFIEIYSNISSVGLVLYSRINSLLYNEWFNEVQRQEQKSVKSSIIRHLIAPFNYVTEIDKNIYLGNAYNAADFSYINILEIDVIINVTKEISNFFEENDSLKYYKLEIEDNNNENMSQFIT